MSRTHHITRCTSYTKRRRKRWGRIFQRQRLKRERRTAMDQIIEQQD